MKKLQKEPESTSGRIRTGSGVDVTERVKDGRTRLFFKQSSAQNHADQRRSYVYPAYDGKYNLIGFAVPN